MLVDFLNTPLKAILFLFVQIIFNILNQLLTFFAITYTNRENAQINKIKTKLQILPLDGVNIFFNVLFSSIPIEIA